MDNSEIMLSWQQFLGELATGWASLQSAVLGLLLEPWGQLQIVFLIALYGVSTFLAGQIEPRLDHWIRSLDTTRQWLKLLVIVLRRLKLEIFVVGAWILLIVMRATTWPSRSYFIGVVASIATVWLAVNVISRLVKNKLAARVLTYVAMSWAAIQVLGLMPTVITILDSAAISSGDFRLSLLTVARGLLLLVVLLPLAVFVSNFIEKRLATFEDISPSMRVLASKTVRIGLIAVAVIFGLQSTGLNLTTLTVFSGAIGLGLGFGLQKIVSNLISGVILLLDKSVKPGDVIEVGDTWGQINKLGSRFVSVVTRDGREYLIPNEDLITNQVINWSFSDPRVRLEIAFGVSYDADPLTVRKIAIEAASKPKRVLGVPSPVCHLVAYGESSVDYVLRFWVGDPSGGVVNIRSEVLIALWYALKEAGISIPYAHRDINVVAPVRVEIAEPASEPRPRTTRPRKG
ncbi:MAG: mechanosensitive ion channel [Hyphomicrobiaceae bacterium]|nr:mechanosensitive ion channel [Hyphomicrobiaceae bacterium]